jgi:hypothetical protein
MYQSDFFFMLAQSIMPHMTSPGIEGVQNSQRLPGFPWLPGRTSIAVLT